MGKTKYVIVFIGFLMLISAIFLIRFQCKAIRQNLTMVDDNIKKEILKAVEQAIEEIERKQIVSHFSTEITAGVFDSVPLNKKLIIDLLLNKYRADSSYMNIVFFNNSSNPLTNINEVPKNKDKTFLILHLIASINETKVNFSPSLDTVLLKKTLRKYFGIYQITDTFEFAIVDSAGKYYYKTPHFKYQGDYNLLVSMPIFDYPFLNNSGYKLLLYFPERRLSKYSYLYKNVVFPTLGLSVLIIIIFTISIVVLVKQRKLSELKSKFINNITHELKTPISTIKISSDMLKNRDLNLEKEMIHSIGETIHNEANRLLFLIEKMLLIANIEKGTAIIRKDFYDAHQLIQESISTFKVIIRDNGGELFLELNAEQTTIYVDKFHFVNIVNNLLDNAVKYKKPSRPLKIYLRTYNEADYFVLEIQDNGIGIKKENLTRIFDEFYRAVDIDRHNVKGFGLGLSYVKYLVKEFDGKIDVKSEVDVGTTFIIKFPIIKMSEN